MHGLHSLFDLCRFSGITHPTWRELCNFIEFLNYQLYVAEQSVHLNGTIPGLKAFIVKFLIRMSKVCLYVWLTISIKLMSSMYNTDIVVYSLQLFFFNHCGSSS